MKNLKSEKGSITLFVLLSTLFFFVIVVGVAVSLKNKETAVDKQFSLIKNSYEQEINNLANAYSTKINGARIYAKLYSDGTLVLSSSDTTVAGKTLSKDYGLIKDKREDNYWSSNPPVAVTTVTINDEISPTTTAYWFSNCSSLTTINNIERLKTDLVRDMTYMFYNCSSLSSLDVSNFNTERATNMFGMFCNCSNLTALDVTKFDTRFVTNMRSMFNSCKKLTTLDLRNFNTSKVTTMYNMFYKCEALQNLEINNSFNTANVTNMKGMFQDCKLLATINTSGFNTENVTTMEAMFNGCNAVTKLDLNNFNTAKVTTMKEMFQDCTSLKELNVLSFNTENVTTMEYMFNNCNKLTVLLLTNFNTAKVTTMKWMFAYCESLENLNVTSFNTENVTDMYGMFAICKKLTELDVSRFNTSKVTDMQSLFNSCYSMKELDVSGFDTSNVVRTQAMFMNCYELTNLDLSSFDTRKVTNMHKMFVDCNKLVTIYASSEFYTTQVSSSSGMFENCTALVGGNGTIYDAEKTNKTYARIDVEGTKGYFTSGTGNITVAFNANGGDVSTKSKTVKAGGTYGTLPTPTREGYTFEGWNGKNKFDFSIENLETISASNWQQNSGKKYGFNLGVLDAKTYTLSYDLVDENDVPTYFYISRIDKNNECVLVGYLTTDRVSTKKRVFQADGESQYIVYWALAEVNTLEKAQVRTAKLKNIQLEEGNTATAYEPYYITADTKVVLEDNISNNLISRDKNDWEQGGIVDANGTLTGMTTRIRTKNFIQVSPNKLYRLSTNNDKDIVIRYVWFYDENYNFINRTSTNRSTLNEFTTPNNCKYIKTVLEYRDENKAITTDNLADANITLTDRAITRTLTAIWEKNEKVTFDANGGTVGVSSKDVEVGQPYGELPVPTREGYTFKGWNGKNKFNISNTSKSNVTVIGNQANFDASAIENNQASSLNIQLYYSDGSGLTTVWPNNHTNVGFAYATFTLTKEASNMHVHLNTNRQDGRLIISCKDIIEINKIYTISYNIDSVDFAHAKATVSNIQLEEGNTATTYEPYFVTSDTIVTRTGNHTLTAIWEKDEVVFDANGGYIRGDTNLFENRSLKVNNITTYTKNNDVYTFTTENPYPSISIPNDIFENNKAYTIKYKVKKKSGTLKTLGGHSVATTKIQLKVDGNISDYSYNCIYNIKDDELIHEVEYKFIYNNTGVTDPGIYIQPNRTMGNLITYDLWDIQVFEENQTESKYVIAGQPYGTVPTPERVGYTFKGWNGKNIINIEESSIAGIKDGTSFNAWGIPAFDNAWIIANLKPSTRYTISYDVECTEIPKYDSTYSENYGFFIYGLTNNSYAHASMLPRKFLSLNEKINVIAKFTSSSKITDSSENYSMYCYTNLYTKNNTYVGSKMKFSNIQLEEGDTATAYEPYYITSDTTVVQGGKHTLTAIWEKN